MKGSVSGPKSFIMERWGFRFRSQELHHGKMRVPFPVPSIIIVIRCGVPFPDPSTLFTDRWEFRSYHGQMRSSVSGLKISSRTCSRVPFPVPRYLIMDRCMRILFPIPSDVNKNEFSAGLKTVARRGTPFPVPVPTWWVYYFQCQLFRPFADEKFCLRSQNGWLMRSSFFRSQLLPSPVKDTLENIPISISRTTILDRKESDRSAVPFPVSAMSFCIKNFRAKILFTVYRT